MIKKLNILNFQSHKDTSLSFAPGVNVIVGASDSGKSAIIRALRWLIWNRPVGDAFRSHWGGQTSVEIVLPERHSMEAGAHKDQTTIMRSKSDTHNQYFWNGTDNVFKAFGNDVPQPIQEILNLDETNLQRQGDSPFLISATPGEVSGYFNRIAKLDKIDSSLKYITSKAKGLTSQIKSDESRLQDLELEAGKFGYLDGAEAQLEVLEVDLKAQNQRRSGLTNLKNLRAELHLVEHDMLEEQHTVSLEEAVLALQKMITQRDDIKTKLDDLVYGKGMLVSYKEAEDSHQDQQKLFPLIDEVLYNQGVRDARADDITAFKDLVKEISMLAINTAAVQTKLDNLESEFTQNMPDTCPLCGK